MPVREAEKERFIRGNCLDGEFYFGAGKQQLIITKPGWIYIK